jgi:hypothetical protein
VVLTALTGSVTRLIHDMDHKGSEISIGLAMLRLKTVGVI